MNQFVFSIVMISAILLQLVSCNNQEHGTNNLLVRSHLELTASVISVIDSIPIVNVSVQIYNPTDDTLQLLSMSCSYENLFKTSNSEYSIKNRYDCFINYFTVIDLAPYQKVEKLLMITGKRNSIIENLSIGMYAIQPSNNEVNKFDNLYSRKEEFEVIWSNAIKAEIH